MVEQQLFVSTALSTEPLAASGNVQWGCIPPRTHLSPLQPSQPSTSLCTSVLPCKSPRHATGKYTSVAGCHWLVNH